MPPAARVNDMHSCTASDPGNPPIPHVGGPITGPGAPTVLIEKAAAACVGDQAVCIGPADELIKGSANVLILGKPAVRVGDPTAHGGQVVQGASTVMIGG